MALRTLEELKSFFENGDYPNESNFEDLIDSCYNATVSGDSLFQNNLTVNGNFYCDNIILKNNLGDEYKLIVTTQGVLSTIPFFS